MTLISMALSKALDVHNHDIAETPTINALNVIVLSIAPK
jgi:hypothetical protein